MWQVTLDPATGAEIKKTRPAVVVSSDGVGRLPVKLVALLTAWQAHFALDIWHVRIEPDRLNGLTKTSAVDVLQIRGVDTSRMISRLGCVSETVMTEITAAIAAVIERV